MKPARESFRIDARPIVLGAVVFALMLIANAPAAWLASAAPASQFTYVRAEGTIWDGVIRGARAGDAPLGDIEFRTHPLRLLAGELRADLSLKGGVIDGAGAIGLGLGGVTVRDADFTARLGRVRGFGFMGEPLQGEARVSIERLKVTEAGCRDAAGEIWTDALDAPARRFESEGFALSGPVTCDGNDVLAALEGEGQEGSARLAIRVKPGLTYVFEAAARPARPEMGEALVYMGFERAGGALVYASTGAIKGTGS